MAQNLTVKKGQCINFGNCPKANSKEIIEVNLGDDFICPECEGALVEIVKPPTPKWILYAVIAAVIAIGAGTYFYLSGDKSVENTGGESTKASDTVTKDTAPVEKSQVSVASVSLNKTAVEIKLNGTATLAVSVLPDNADNKNVSWSSSDETTVKVNSNGEITGVAEGTAEVTVKAVADNSLSASCTVKVVKESKQAPVVEPKGSVTVSGGTYTGELKDGKPHGMGTMRYTSRTLIDSRDTKKRYAEAGQYITGEFYNGRPVQVKLFDSNNNQLETIVLGRAN